MQRGDNFWLQNAAVLVTGIAIGAALVWISAKSRSADLIKLGPRLRDQPKLGQEPEQSSPRATLSASNSGQGDEPGLPKAFPTQVIAPNGSLATCT